MTKRPANITLAITVTLLIILLLALTSYKENSLSRQTASTVSASKQIAYGYTVLAGMRYLTYESVKEGTLTAAKARQIQLLANLAHMRLDTAQLVPDNTTNIDAAANVINKALLILNSGGQDYSVLVYRTNLQVLAFTMSRQPKIGSTIYNVLCSIKARQTELDQTDLTIISAIDMNAEQRLAPLL